MPLKQLTQQQFNTTDGTVYAINIDMEDMDTVDLANYLEAKCKGWFMQHYDTNAQNQFLFQHKSDTKHYKNWSGWTVFKDQITNSVD